MSAQYRPYRDEDNGGDSEPMTWPDHEPTGAVQIYEKTTEDIRVVSHRNLVIGGLGIALLGVLAGLLVGYFAHTEHSGCVRGKSVAIHAVYDADPSIRARLLGLIKAEGINRTAGQLLELRTDPEIVELLQKRWKDQGLEAVQLHTYEVLLSFPDSSRPNRLRHFASGSDKEGAVLDLFTEDHRPYVAYCTDNGAIRGPLVYAGRLHSTDVDWLHGSNVTLEGSVLLVRLGTEPLGQQLAMAQRAGARAVLLYPDPREFRPLPPSYPEEQEGSTAWWWLPPDGSHSASPLGPLLGDPQTPGYPAVVSAHRLPREQVYLPMVPAQTISASVAEILLRHLGGPPMTVDMQGSLGGEGNASLGAGPGPVEVELQLHNMLRNQSVFDLVGYVRGRVEPDRYVLVGAGRDAWGDSDIGSTALLLELSAAFGTLLKAEGWRPRRTVIFCSWAAEEFQSVGVVEWLEENLKLLHGRVVAYIDLGQPVLGSTSLSVAASPLLYHAVFNATRQVPTGGEGSPSVYKQWVATFPKHRNASRLLFPPMAGSAAPAHLEEGEDWDDFSVEPLDLLTNYRHAAMLPVRPAVRAMDVEGSYAAFFSQAGIPVVQMSYVDDILQKRYITSKYNRKHEQYIGSLETFRVHVSGSKSDFSGTAYVAAVAGELLRTLADSLFLPFNLFDYAQLLKDLCISLHLHTRHGLDLAPLDAAVQNFSDAAYNFHSRQNELDTSDPMAIRMVNDQLLLLERVFLDPRGLPRNPYKKHLVLSPPELPTFLDEMFPGIMDEFTRLVDELGSPTDAGPHLDVLRQHYALLVQVIQQAA
ncbi:hypothetical protein HPB51_006637 [Rhipicephalus microplus]|uniref:Glutamate carboxypeptidase n=1 Tax=Rhipicephalus microplus TaxID=6941 RepID=A0A9J6E7T9_RHIMP|nr:hypothetical protein HPB51_006637 [Rhipicephalus microplus]